MGFLFASSSLGTSQSRSGEAAGRLETEAARQGGSSEVLRALDELFTPSTVTKQNIVNVVGALGGTVWLMLLSLSSSSAQSSKKRSFDPYENLWESANNIFDQNWNGEYDSIRF